MSQAPILVVEDSLAARVHLRAQLESAGFTVVLTESVSEAAQALSHTVFGAAIVDAHLRDASGMDVLALPALRRARLRTLVLSSDSSIATRISYLKAGATTFLGKPAAKPLLVRCISALVAGKSELGTFPVTGPAQVLLVDDSGTYSVALSGVLGDDGHDVVCAPTLDLAKRYLELAGADCVIIDAYLGDDSGVELCAYIRATHPRPIALAMLTGRDKVELRDAALAAGADVFLTKDASLSAVRQEVASLLARGPQRGARRAARTPDNAEVSQPMSHPASHVARPGSKLFDVVVRELGVSGVFAATTVQRACKSAGVDPSRLAAPDLPRVVPFLKRSLVFFMPPAEVDERIQHLQDVVRQMEW